MMRRRASIRSAARRTTRVAGSPSQHVDWPHHHAPPILPRMSRIAIIPGDGIGVDVTREAVKVLEAVRGDTGIDLELVEWNLGAQIGRASCRERGWRGAVW